MTTLVDTSCLLRLLVPADPRQGVTLEALRRLHSQGEPLVIARQNVIEFRGVATRPASANGLGLTLAEADVEIDTIEQLFPFVPELMPERIYAVWRGLCTAAGVSGKQVHDTRLVAVCQEAGVTNILTWNPTDFQRFLPYLPQLVVRPPDEVVA